MWKTFLLVEDFDCCNNMLVAEAFLFYPCIDMQNPETDFHALYLTTIPRVGVRYEMLSVK